MTKVRIEITGLGVEDARAVLRKFGSPGKKNVELILNNAVVSSKVIIKNKNKEQRDLHFEFRLE